jgi:ribosome-associated translation inhibitor RaiA
MQTPLRITFRGMDASPALTEDIEARVGKLEQVDRRIIGCHVVVEQPHQHHHQGRRFHVRVDVSVPGREIVVERDPGKDPAHEDPFVAVRDAFRAARRRLASEHQRH